jgi:hypothetical protein
MTATATATWLSGPVPCERTRTFYQREHARDPTGVNLQSERPAKGSRVRIPVMVIARQVTDYMAQASMLA